MLESAHANVRLKTEVTEIIPKNGSVPSFRVVTNSSSTVQDDEFDQVIFAAPWHLSPIDKAIARDFSEKIP